MPLLRRGWFSEPMVDEAEVVMGGFGIGKVVDVIWRMIEGLSIVLVAYLYLEEFESKATFSNALKAVDAKSSSYRYMSAQSCARS